jgi:hypothetical protein
MIADVLDVHLPSLHGMALFAVGSELAAMNVRVAIGATGADVAEDQAGMALRAANVLVKTA